MRLTFDKSFVANKIMFIETCKAMGKDYGVKQILMHTKAATSSFSLQTKTFTLLKYSISKQ